MRVRIVIRRQLSLDIRKRNVTAHAQDHSFRHVREIQINIGHHGVPPVLLAEGSVWLHSQQLLAEDSLGGRKTIIPSIQAREPEPPVEMVRLNGVGSAFDISHELIELYGIGDLRVSRWRVCILAADLLSTTAEIHSRVRPTIDLDVRLLPPIAVRAVLQGRGQRIGRGIVVTHPHGATDRPYAEGIWRTAFHRRVPAILRLFCRSWRMPIVGVRFRQPAEESTLNRRGDHIPRGRGSGSDSNGHGGIHLRIGRRVRGATRCGRAREFHRVGRGWMLHGIAIYDG